MDGDTPPDRSAETDGMIEPVSLDGPPEPLGDPSRRTDFAKALLGILLIATDIAALTAAFILGYWARENLPLFTAPPAQPALDKYVPTLLLHVGTIVIIFYLTQMYHLRRAISRIDHARNIFGAVTVGALMVNGIQELVFKNTLLEPVDYPRSMFFYVWIFSVALVILGREINAAVRRFLRRRGIEKANLIVVGMGKIAREIIRKIEGSPELGYHLVGVVTVRSDQKSRDLGAPILGHYPELAYLIDQHNVEQVIIAVPDAHRDELVELISFCRRGRVDIKIYPDMFAYIARDLSVDDLGGTPLVTVRDVAMRGWRLSFKRGMDIVGAMVGLIFLSPFMLLTAILIKLESPGPVFYTQTRMGLDERPFEMIKFRSMRIDAEATGPGWTVENDPRVTRSGRFLRKTNLDEFPQLINVLIGEMSLVGPRPERPVYVQQFREQIPRYMERHREKAGMTGWAQVNGLRGDTSISERTIYDLWYIENWSLWLDIKIVIRTILNTVLRRDQNAY
ncbi:MAG: undecaprenyl-phosphate glucose phosphotransferase [Anaerolineae bacterium]|nr:undecaprenyl-phosphate glucose phosphotransferase [Anaerolineae bacterium]NUQ05467.1 undecaprenyl-phosphate glucose phosphotransferase [Anaerolineae bacterium]